MEDPHDLKEPFNEYELEHSSILFTFEAFDPIEGIPPDTVAGKFWPIAYRARAILKNRSRQEIIAATDTISWLRFSDIAWEWQHKETEALVNSVNRTGNYDENFIGPYGADVSLLNYAMERISLDGLNEAIPDLSWPELFAALTLGMIDRAAEWERREPDHVEQNTNVYHWWHGVFAIEAMEAVCIAEGLLKQEKSQIERKKAISNARQRAALKRHQKTNDLKREFIHFCATGNFKSDADAARRFLGALDSDKKQLLAPSNAINTLLRALRADRKGK